MSEVIEMDLNKAIKNKINRSKWVKWKFTDLVENIVEKVVPKDSGLEHYIGLEHLDSGSLKIRRFGETSSLIGAKLKIYKGDLIFAKRNAYLKRVAIADFDAVASAHSMVLRPKVENILPEFLPFFLLSEQFWQRAIEISVGSLSPTINWKSLAKQEFFLPPKDLQTKLAELLWALDEVIEKKTEAYKMIDCLFKSKTKFISDNHLHNGEYKKIKEVCIIKDNMRKPVNSKSRDQMKGEIPYYGANGVVDFVDDFIFDEELVLLAEDGGNFKEFYSKEIAYHIKGKSWINNHAHVLTVKEGLFSIDWLHYSLVHKNILKFITGTTRLKLNKTELENIQIWVPSNDTINSLVCQLNKTDSSRHISKRQLKNTKNLQKSLINQIF